MKHLFFVHSNITYLSALGVICKDNLPLSEVKIISTHFVIDSPIAVERIQFRTFGSALIHFELLSWLNLYKSVSIQIDQLVEGDQYIAYVPSVPFPVNILITHPCCVKFNFIEEGLSNYIFSLPLETVCQLPATNSFYFNMKDLLVDSISNYRQGGSRINRLPYLYDLYNCVAGIAFYGFFEQTFVNVEKNKVQIDLDTIVNRFYMHYLDSLDVRDGDMILLGTTATDKSLYLSRIEHCIQSLQCTDNLWVKFHPREAEDTKIKILEMINRQGIPYTVLNRDVMVEVILARKKNLTVFGALSSLNLYAGLLGHKSYDYSSGLYPVEVYDAVSSAFNTYVTKL